MADKENALENGMLATPVKASPGAAAAPTATGDLISFETPAPGRGAAAAGTLAGAAATLTWDAATPAATTTGGGALAAELAALRAELVARDVRVDAAEAEVRRLEAAHVSQAAELADALQQIADMEVAQTSITARHQKQRVAMEQLLSEVQLDLATQQRWTSLLQEGAVAVRAAATGLVDPTSAAAATAAATTPPAHTAVPTSLAELIAYAEEERAARSAVIDDLARQVEQLKAHIVALGGTVPAAPVQ